MDKILEIEKQIAEIKKSILKEDKNELENENLENANLNGLIDLPKDNQKDEFIPKEIKNKKGFKNIERSKSHENNSKTKKSLLKKKIKMIVL